MRCSLYIHLPFCVAKCRYCDFFSVAEKNDLIDDYIDAVAKEWRSHVNDEAVEITSIYIGGGTPSLLTEKQWLHFNAVLLKHLPKTDDCEWTVECNPESFSSDKADLLYSMGANRLTLGVQSMNDRILRFCKRPHVAEKVDEILDNPVLQHFSSVGVDVMYGLPGQTVDLFADTLHRILKHSVVRHLSAYELTIVPVTPFGRHQRLLPLPDDDTVIEMYALLEEISLRYRFDHYEVSNFSRKEHRCRHNENYWNHQPYIGLGCSAHSYIHPRRFWNFKDINRYITTLSKGQNPVEGEELLSEGMLAREMVFLGFRKKEGVNERLFNERTGFHFKAWAGEERLQQFIDNKLLIYDSPWWRPTEKGMMSADFLARELI